jgi:hypothetical protein
MKFFRAGAAAIKAAEKLWAWREMGRKRRSGAKALADSVGLMRGLKPPPPSEPSFSAARIAILCLATFCLATFAGTSAAQSPAPAQPSSRQAGQSAQQPAAQPASPAQPGGQVIFSRSTDENGQTTTQAGPAAAPPDIRTVTAPTVEDADRRAVTTTDLDLDVHLRTAEQQIAVRALVTVRNDGKTPLAHIPLEISSSLNWERIRVDGKDVAFTVAMLNSDTDHTGQLREADISLAGPAAEPLAPGSVAKLDVTYSGTIPADAKRLLAIGAPDDVALQSDWDQISVPFTGLRGFGNVVWYPVSSVPVILGDGARVFDEIGEHKLRLFGAQFRLRLAVEYPPGQAPTVALINGRRAPLAVTDAAPGGEVIGVATADSGPTVLGFEAPSLFVAIRTPHPGKEMNLFALPDDSASVDAWTAAGTAVAPFVQGWLGERPRGQLTLLDLPDPHDAPFETGSMLAVPIRSASPDQLQGVLVHALSHAYLLGGPRPPPAWLDEGVANFMGTLWTERQQGREKALESLEASRPALALAEPESPGEGAGQPLLRADSPIYYRTKAAYVLWMLRDIAGEPALSAALRASDSAPDVVAADNGPADRKPIGNGANPAGRDRLELLLEQAGAHLDLSWFFADWVDADHGLPDLSIESVFPTSATPDSWLVAVNLANNGYAAAEVPVTVRSVATSVTERVLVPARSKVSRRILIQGKPTEVQLNDGGVPETQASVHITSLDQPESGSSSSASPQP